VWPSDKLNARLAAVALFQHQDLSYFLFSLAQAI
jgi:hypothetical protein